MTGVQTCALPISSIDEVSAVLKNAKLLVCHDSGQMHIGNAHRTPLLALYGPTDDVFTAPKAPASRMLRLPLPCAPCMKNFAKTEVEAVRDCPIQIRCMRELPLDEVWRACKEMLVAFPRADGDPAGMIKL